MLYVHYAYLNIGRADKVATTELIFCRYCQYYCTKVYDICNSKNNLCNFFFCIKKYPKVLFVKICISKWRKISFTKWWTKFQHVLLSWVHTCRLKRSLWLNKLWTCEHLFSHSWIIKIDDQLFRNYFYFASFPMISITSLKGNRNVWTWLNLNIL